MFLLSGIQLYILFLLLRNNTKKFVHHIFSAVYIHYTYPSQPTYTWLEVVKWMGMCVIIFLMIKVHAKKSIHPPHDKIIDIPML